MDIEVTPLERSPSIPFPLNVSSAQKTYRRLYDPVWNQKTEAAGILDSFNNAKTIEDEEKAVDGFTKLAGFWFPEAVGGDTDIAVLRPGKPVAWPQRKVNCKD
jgi:hypothetical protein